MVGHLPMVGHLQHGRAFAFDLCPTKSKSLDTPLLYVGSGLVEANLF